MLYRQQQGAIALFMVLVLLFMMSAWAVVVLVLGYHHACGVLLKRFRRDANRRGHVWYRWFNEVPVLLLLVAVVLVVVKPF